jgi:hypothetical protein
MARATLIFISHLIQTEYDRGGAWTDGLYYIWLAQVNPFFISNHMYTVKTHMSKENHFSKEKSVRPINLAVFTE